MFWSLIHLSAQISSLSFARFLSAMVLTLARSLSPFLMVHRPSASLLLCYCISVLFYLCLAWFGFLSGRILSTVSANANTQRRLNINEQAIKPTMAEKSMHSKNKTKIAFETKAAAVVI